MHSRTSAKRRLLLRLLSLSFVAVVTYFLQKGFAQGGQGWMFLLELSCYVVILVVYLNQQTGRLKSEPESGKVTFRQLVADDSAATTGIAAYLFLLMIFLLGMVLLEGSLGSLWVGPWSLFAAAAPFFVIVFWRQYRLEERRESS